MKPSEKEPQLCARCGHGFKYHRPDCCAWDGKTQKFCKCTGFQEKPLNNTAIEFEVPRIPMTINRLSREHWSKRVAEKKVWGQEFLIALRHEGIRTLRAWAECGNRVRIEVHVIHNREFDPDNLASVCKIPLDTLKSMGCLIDDGKKFIDLPMPTQELANRKLTRFKITRLDGEAL